VATVSPAVEFRIPTSGVRADLDRPDVGPRALAEGDNWLVRDGEFIVRPGTKTFATDTNQRPMGYVQYEHNDGALRTVKGTIVGWWKYVPGSNTWSDITEGGKELTGTILEQTVFRVFQKAGTTTLLGVNGKDVPKKWDGDTATYLDMAGSPPKAKCIAISADRILLANLLSGGTISPVAIDVSANKDFDSGWGNVQVSLLADTPGDIISMMELGNLVTAIYKTDAIYVSVAQGGPAPFAYQLKRAAKGLGPVSPLAVAQGPEGIHVYLARDSTLKIFDGVAPRSLADHIDKHIKKTIDEDNSDIGFIFYDENRKEVWVIYPSVGSTNPNAGFILNIKTLALWPISWGTLRMTAGASLFVDTGLTIGDLTGTIGSQSGTIGAYGTRVRRTILGDIGGESFEDVGNTDDGVAITTLWETGVSDGGQSRQQKTVKEIFHQFPKTANTQNVTVKLGKALDGQERVLDAGKVIDISGTPPFVSQHRQTGNGFSLRIEASTTEPVKYKGAAITSTKRGIR